MWCVLNVFVVCGLVLEGRVGRDVIVAALPGVPVVLLASWLGHQVARRLSQKQFADGVAVLLCIAGILTIARNAG